MPIGNFSKCMSGDIKHASKNKYYSGKKAKKYWSKIFNEHIQEHGLPESYVQYIEKMKKAVDCYDKAYSGKRWMLVKARIYEAEAEQMISSEGEKIETICAKISKYMGYPVRANQCSVSEFYNYVAIMANN